MEQQEQKHQRRVRYKGTHPRTFQEKYKEHQPEKYADTIDKKPFKRYNELIKCGSIRAAQLLHMEKTCFDKGDTDHAERSRCDPRRVSQAGRRAG